MVYRSFLTSFYQEVEEASTILLTAHFFPDDDSIGSVLSLYFILKERYPEKRVTIVYSGEPSSRWKTFANAGTIEFVADIAQEINDYDLLICLDGNRYGRFTRQGEVLAESRARKVCIDHHATQADQFDLSLIDVEATSTTEIIYNLFSKDTIIPAPLAELYLLGILGDTDGLRFISRKNDYLLPLVKDLMRAALVGNLAEFSIRYKIYSRAVFTCIQEFMKNATFRRVDGWPEMSFSYVSREFVSHHGYTDQEIKEASHIYTNGFSTAVEGIVWGCMCFPQANGDVYIDVDSRPGAVKVREIVEGMHIGGGHDYAAGGTFRTKNNTPREPLECFDEVVAWLEAHPCE